MITTHKTAAFRRITSLLLALVMVLGMLPGIPHVHAEEAEGYTYTLRFRQSKPDPGVNAFDGDHIDVSKSEDNYSGGRKLLITATVLDAAGTKTKDTNAWVGLFRGKHTKQTDFAEEELMFSYDIKGKTSGGSAHNGLDMPIGNKNLDLYADDYTIVLFQDETDDVPLHLITFSIYWDNITETITKEATCTEDGQKHQVYVGAYKDKNNNTTQWEYDVPIPALGHDVPAWTKVEGSNTHTGSCTRDESHVLTEACTIGEDNLCSVCGGEYVLVEVSRETVAPSCETEGYTLITYADGTTRKVDIVEALGHDYTWTRVAGTNTHTGSCANDADHVVTEACAFENDICTVCGGALVTLYTDKAVYAYGDPILVNAVGGGSDWVGLYKKGETYNPDAGGVKSIFWYYISEQSQTDVNILTTRDENGRSGEFVAGKYTVVLFRNDSYTAAATVDITVTTEIDDSKTVTVEATCTEDGSVTYYNTDGTVANVEVLEKLGHDWEIIEYNGDETHTIRCSRCSVMDAVACTWDEGVVTTPATPTEKGVLTYTCGECGGTKTEDIPATGATEVSRQTVAPDCEEEGYTLVTYSDGTTQKIDIVPALGHDITGASYDDCTHVEGTHTHRLKCQREGCDGYGTEDCTLETDGVLSGTYFFYSCTKCGEWTEGIISTNKEVYAYGEPILVTVHPNYTALGATDWIGLYEKGFVPSTNTPSIYWDYAAAPGTAFNILTAANAARPNDYIAGEYTIYLCANDGYTVIGSANITVTTELDESKTVRTEPTCTEDGYITYYNTDGTVAKVITAKEDETLKATGHSYSDWSYDGVELQTHTRCCENGCDSSETARCTFDGGIVTKEPTATETGIKTYTCTVCGGTKTEVLPKTSVTITGTETVAATCEAAGYIRTFYSDGTHSDEVLPALGHNYGEWVFDQESLSHSKTCANDAAHVIREDCTISTAVSGTTATHSCNLCGGSYKTGLMQTNKTSYGVSNDPMMVTVYAAYPDAWVGLYKKGENADSNAGGIESMYWSYVTQDMVGQPFNLLADANFNTDRNERLTNGDYVLRFFGDGGYSKILCEIDLTVFTDMSNTTFELLFYKAAARENGYHRNFKLEEVDNPAGGEKVTLGVNVTSGEAGSSWVGVYRELHNLDTDYNELDYILFRNIADIDGKTPFSLNWADKGGFTFEVGDYTIVIFEDATCDKPVMYITFSVTRTIVSETVRREATCTTPGLKEVLYEGDEASTYVVIPALGHAYGDWACVEDTDTHIRYCSREDCGETQSEACTYVDAVCSVCGGAQHAHSLTKVDAVEATCAKPGSIEYYTCACGKWFLDEAGTEEITDPESVVVEALAHSYGEWIYDDTARTHTRTCAQDAAHTETENCTFDEGVVVTDPAGSKAGLKKYTCTVCGGSYTEEFTDAPAAGSFERIYGANRFETMIAVADQLKENLGIEKFSTVVVACGTNFADALSGSYLANINNAPILLVGTGFVDTVKDYIRKNLEPGGTIYILGGESAVPASMETGMGEYTITRLGGANRFETNLLILKEAGVESGDDLLVCTGMAFADCLSASGVMMPILMVGDTLSGSQISYLDQIKGGKLYIIGGEAAVSKSVESKLGTYGETERILGNNRYETSAAVAKKFFPDADSAVLVYGLNFPDGLCGGALANSINAPVILTANGAQAAADEYAESCGVSQGFVLGGTTLISDAVATTIFTRK